MIVTRRIQVNTRGECDIQDITPRVAQQLRDSGARDGTVTVFVAGSTAGITTIEHEPGLVADFRRAWERLVPRDERYEHDRRWGDGNGFSHVRASLLGASLVLPFEGGRLCLGTWQQIVLVDFDNRPRRREIVVQVAGE